MSSATYTPSRSRSAWAAWATLPTSVRMSTYALSIRAALLGVGSGHLCLTAGTWPGMFHKAGQPAATRPEDLGGIVGAGGGAGQPVDRHSQPPAATGTAAW